ncbi:hypothetical protein [Xanthomonas sacchari]|uniref:hypothetical protein n=1 Tax=Xanthomonas sacchari TaxID=56458 RepID=UPI0003A9E8B5|nr:hypothetical protein [Xanthomonas sacchari]
MRLLPADREQRRRRFRVAVVPVLRASNGVARDTFLPRVTAADGRVGVQRAAAAARCAC